MSYTFRNDSISTRIVITVDIIDWYPYSIVTAYRPTRQLTSRYTCEAVGVKFLGHAEAYWALMHYFVQYNSCIIRIMMIIISLRNPALTMRPPVSGDTTIRQPSNRTHRTANTATHGEATTPKRNFGEKSQGSYSNWRTGTVALILNNVYRHAPTRSQNNLQNILLQRPVSVYYRNITWTFSTATSHAVS
jgi:hypothetical protein